MRDILSDKLQNYSMHEVDYECKANLFRQR